MGRDWTLESLVITIEKFGIYLTLNSKISQKDEKKGRKM